MEAPTDYTQVAAYDALKRIAKKAGYRVVATSDDAFWTEGTPYDVDMAIGFSNGSITLRSRVGRRAMNRLSADFVPLDEGRLAALWADWQEQFKRLEEAKHHSRSSGSEVAQRYH
jgi:hypothetical protein